MQALFCIDIACMQECDRTRESNNRTCVKSFSQNRTLCCCSHFRELAEQGGAACLGDAPRPTHCLHHPSALVAISWTHAGDGLLVAGQSGEIAMYERNAVSGNPTPKRSTTFPCSPEKWCCQGIRSRLPRIQLLKFVWVFCCTYNKTPGSPSRRKDQGKWPGQRKHGCHCNCSF